MKLLLLLIFLFNEKFVSNEDAKKYITYFITTLSVALPFTLFGDINQKLYVSFNAYTITSWLLFWIIISFSTFFNKTISFNKILLPTVAIFFVSEFGFNLYTLILLEITYLLNILVIENKYFNIVQLSYFFKLILFVYLIFGIRYLEDSYGLILSVTFLILIMAEFVNSILLDSIFRKFYLMMFCLHAIANLDQRVNSFNIIIYSLTALSFISQLRSIIPKLGEIKIPNVLLNNITMIKLKVYHPITIQISGSADVRKLKIKSKLNFKNFNNDLASTMLLTLLIMLVLIANFLYRLH